MFSFYSNHYWTSIWFHFNLNSSIAHFLCLLKYYPSKWMLLVCMALLQCLFIIIYFIGFLPFSLLPCFQHLFNTLTLEEFIFWKGMHQIPKNQASYFQKLSELQKTFNASQFYSSSNKKEGTNSLPILMPFLWMQLKQSLLYSWLFVLTFMNNLSVTQFFLFFPLLYTLLMLLIFHFILYSMDRKLCKY